MMYQSHCSVNGSSLFSKAIAHYEKSSDKLKGKL